MPAPGDPARNVAAVTLFGAIAQARTVREYDNGALKL